jgi:hypothetical protein
VHIWELESGFHSTQAVGLCVRCRTTVRGGLTLPVALRSDETDSSRQILRHGGLFVWEVTQLCGRQKRVAVLWGRVYMSLCNGCRVPTYDVALLLTSTMIPCIQLYRDLKCCFRCCRMSVGITTDSCRAGHTETALLYHVLFV